MKNLLTNAYIRGEKATYTAISDDCRRMGIKFLPPDINKSDWEFTIEDDCIRIGLCAVKGLGEKAVEEILTKRPFCSLENLLELVEKRRFNKKVVNIAIFSGLMDSFIFEGETRYDFYASYMDSRKEEVAEEISFGKGFVINTQADLSDLEEACLGAQFTTDPANDMQSFGWGEIRSKQRFKAEAYIRKVKKIKTKNNKPMAFVEVSTGDGSIECTVFPNVYEKAKKLLKKKQFCVLTAQKETSESCILQDISAA